MLINSHFPAAFSTGPALPVPLTQSPVQHTLQHHVLFPWLSLWALLKGCTDAAKVLPELR